jgi:DNA-directed RNA polymerase subunit RPC12/RpoP
MKDKRSPSPTEEHQEPQTEERTFTCSECGESFGKPLLANVSSQGHVQAYYACPRCLAEIREDDEAETDRNEPSASQEEPGKEQPKLQNENCQHFLGYLGKRPRETPIPEACLTCGKIIECMATG